MVATGTYLVVSMTALEEEYYENLLELHSSERCNSVKIVQLRGEFVCRRRPGHVGRHWDDRAEVYWD